MRRGTIGWNKMRIFSEKSMRFSGKFGGFGCENEGFVGKERWVFIEEG